MCLPCYQVSHRDFVLSGVAEVGEGGDGLAVEALEEGGGEAEGVEVVVDVDDAVVGVDVAGGNAKHYRGNAEVVEVDDASIGAAAAANRHLVGDLEFPGEVANPMNQAP